MKSTALVFSGGALRGFAQIGAYEVIDRYLREIGGRVDLAVGTSFGSITASLVALGFSPGQMLEMSQENGLSMTGPLDIDITGPSLLRGQHLRKELGRHLGGRTFADTRCELLINAVDALSGEEYLFCRDGLRSAAGRVSVPDSRIPLIDAVTASTAIPAVFRPLEREGHVLLDAGMVNPFALDLVDTERYDLVIGVDVCMANFDFIRPDSYGSFRMVQQAISLMQRQFYTRRWEHIARLPHVKIIRPKTGPVSPRRKAELDRLLGEGRKAAEAVLYGAPELQEKNTKSA